MKLLDGVTGFWSLRLSETGPSELLEDDDPQANGTGRQNVLSNGDIRRSLMQRDVRDLLLRAEPCDGRIIHPRALP
jgi:hypothetical protein